MWAAVYTPTSAVIESNYLFSEGGRVYLGDVRADKKEMIVPITLSISEGSVTGKVSCTVSGKDSAYISAQNLSSSEIIVTKGESAGFQIGMVINDAAVKVLTGQAEVSAHVSFDYKVGTSDCSMSADLVMRLSPPSYEGNEDDFFTKGSADITEKSMFGTCVSFSDKRVLISYSIPPGCNAAIASDSLSLPAGTKYISSYGAEILYSSGYIKLLSSSSGEGAVLLDLSDTEVSEDYVLLIEAVDEDDIYRDSANINLSSTDEIFTFTQKSEGAPIVSDGNELTFSIKQNQILTDPSWTGNGLPTLYFFSVQRLVDGAWQNAEGVSAVYTAQDSDNATVAVSADREIALAGTYRIKARFEYRNVNLSEISNIFFVDYR